VVFPLATRFRRAGSHGSTSAKMADATLTMGTPTRHPSQNVDFPAKFMYLKYIHKNTNAKGKLRSFLTTDGHGWTRIKRPKIYHRSRGTERTIRRCRRLTQIDANHFKILWHLRMTGQIKSRGQRSRYENEWRFAHLARLLHTCLPDQPPRLECRQDTPHNHRGVFR